MKKNNCLYLLLLFCNCAFAQKFSKKNLYFGINAKNKWEIYNTKQEALFLGNDPISGLDAWDSPSKYINMTYDFSIGYKLDKKKFIELGYTHTEYILGGFKLPSFQQGCIGEHLYTVNLESGTNYSFRLGRFFEKQKFRFFFLDLIYFLFHIITNIHFFLLIKSIRLLFLILMEKNNYLSSKRVTSVL